MKANKVVSTCFTHTNKPSAGICSYCKASYCSDCLSLIGEQDEIICKNCYQTLSLGFYTSMLKRKKFIYFGYIIIIISFYAAIKYSGETSGNLSIIMLVSILGLIFLTKKRISEMKVFLKTKEFPLD